MKAVLISVCALAALWLSTTTARADSIVYVKGGDLWLASGDGSTQRQFTSDGGYRTPSQADDGTIVALRGANALHRWDRAGRLLNTLTLETPTPFDPVVSPDGAVVAYWTRSYSSVTGWSYVTSFIRADGATASCAYQSAAAGWPTWLSNSRVMLMNQSNATYSFDLRPGCGTAMPTLWFNGFVRDWYDIAGMHGGATNRTGSTLAVLRSGSIAPQETLVLYEGQGALPAHPLPRCELGNATGPIRGLTWSPDGTQLAHAEDDGIWVTPVPPLFAGFDCSSLAPRLTLPGGDSPSWGPAPVYAPQPPPQPQPPAPPQPQPQPQPQPPPPTRARAPKPKAALVKVCHRGRTIKVTKRQLKRHLRHGDKRGRCRTRRR